MEIRLEIPDDLFFKRLHYFFDWADSQKWVYEVSLSTLPNDLGYFENRWIPFEHRWGSGKHPDLTVALALAVQDARAHWQLFLESIKDLPKTPEPKLSANDILGLLDL